MKRIKSLVFTNKVVSVILAMAILLSTTGLATVFASGNNIWDGSVASGFAGGDGGELTPYEIKTGEQLARAIASSEAGKYYILKNDIYLNDVDKINWSTGEAKSGYTAKAWVGQDKNFVGTELNGDGYTVYGLYINGGDEGGLVSKMTTDSTKTTIKNLGIDKAYIKSTYASAFVGRVQGDSIKLTIDQCYVGSNVTVIGSDAGAFICRAHYEDGGVNPIVRIENCYSLATLDGSRTGLVATNYGAASYFVNSYNAKGAVIVFSASATGTYITNCYQTVDSRAADDHPQYPPSVSTISVDNMKGSDVLTNAAKMPNLNQNDVFVAEGDGKYPTLKVFDKQSEEPDNDPIVIWDGETKTEPSKGTGEQGNPYEIKNAAELAYVIENGGKAGAYYRLTNHIYINDVEQVNWTTGKGIDGYTVNEWVGDNKAFKAAEIDGNGYTIQGLFIDSENPAGLISKITDKDVKLSIKNLGIQNSYVKGKYASAFIGHTQADNVVVTFEKCYVGENVTISGDDAGAFICRAHHETNETATKVSITDCYSLATLNGSRTGFVATNYNVPLTVNTSYNANGAIIIFDPEAWGSRTNIVNSYATVQGKQPHVDNAVYTNFAVIDASDMKGASVLDETGKMPKLNANNAYVSSVSYPTLKVFEKESEEPDNDPVEVWDGTTKTPLSKGTGKVDSPYEISNAAELAYVISNGGEAGAYYILTNHIYINDVEKVNWTTGEKIGDYTIRKWVGDNKAFKAAEINGDGFVIKGLYVDSSGPAGLISKITDKDVKLNIKNLGIESSYIKGQYASAFIGHTQADNVVVTFEKCYVGENVTISGDDAGAFICRAHHETNETATKVSITDCYSLATLNGSRTGFVATNYNVPLTVNTSYNANGAIITFDPGEYGSRTNIVNSYATEQGKAEQTDNAVYTNFVVVAANDMKGTSVLDETGKMPKLNANLSFVANEGYPTLKVFATPGQNNEEPDDNPPEVPSDPKVWDGTTKTAPSKGDGSAKSPYEISNGAELAYVISNGGEGKNYKLTSDIYLNDIGKINWETGAVEGKVNEWTYDNAFSGIINGNGHIIYGLYRKTAGENYFHRGSGLISRVTLGETVTISALGIENAYIKDVNGVSAFVGYAGSSEYAAGKAPANVIIDRCYVGNSVTLIGNIVGAFRGASFGSNDIITNCYSQAKLETTGTETASGIFGNIWSSNVTVSNCYNSNGTITTEPGGFAAISNSYQTVAGKYEEAKTLKLANMKGLDVFTSKSKMTTLNSDGAFVAKEGLPTLAAFEDDAVFVPAEEPGDVWTGAISIGISEGKGTKEEPYIISTASELAYAVKNNGLGGKYFKLSHDIKLNDTSDKMWYNSSKNNQWVISTGFRGHIDGDGHIISGLWFSEATENSAVGFISVFNSGSIKNLGIRYAQVYAKVYAGGFVGKTSTGAEKLIEKCFVDETVYVATKNTDGTGGIVGMAEDMTNSATVCLTIKNCYSKASLVGSTDLYLCGILGNSWRSPYAIEGCYSVGYPVYNASMGAQTTSAYWNFEPDVVNKARAGRKLSDYIKNNYSNVGEANAYTIANVVDIEKMRGNNAKTSMPGLDYTNVYETVSKGTPKLKIFTQITGEDIFVSRDADFFGSGRGTQRDPFIIKTVEHLRYVVESTDTKGKYYKLGNDIYINNTKNENWKKNNPTKWYSHNNQDLNFAGHLDGNGHSIHGIYVNETPTPTASDLQYELVAHGTGLFPYISSEASVRNVHIRDSYISGKGCVGGIAGFLYAGSEKERFNIVGCSVDETVTLHGFTVGGLIGSGNRWVDMIYCYSTAKISNSKGPENRVNGLIGDLWAGKANMLECYTVGYKLLFGTLAVKQSVYTTVEQDGVTVLKQEQMTGDAAKKNMTDFNWDSVWYTKDGKTPQLKVIPYGAEEAVNDEGVRGRVWSGKVASKFAGGSGIENDPYLIETPEQLALIFTTASSKFTYYKMIADIKLNDTSKANWYDENANMWFDNNFMFSGVFDGNGHVVTGLYYKNENKNSAKNIGLFHVLAHDSVIKRLGLSQSRLINLGTDGFTGGFLGQIEHWEPANNPTFKAPRLSECFGDHTVYIEGAIAGGLLGGEQTRIDIENCYFTGELTGDTTGGLVGSSWVGDSYGPNIKNSYAATSDRDPLGGSYGFGSPTYLAGKSFYENAYVDGSVSVDAVKSVSIMNMRGNDALTYMKGFDYNNIWKTVSGGTPVLRCFENAAQYSCKREPKKVEIAFASSGGEKVESIFGIPGYTKISQEELPKPVRNGYKFVQWHHFNAYGQVFSLDVFPNYSITLYPEWETSSFEVNFDGEELDPKYDFNSGIEVYKPGVPGYNANYILSGWKSLHAKANSEINPTFLLSYKNTLNVGEEYEMTFYLNTDEDDTNAKLYLIHKEYPDVLEDDAIGYEEILDVKNLEKGKWTKHTVKFTANAPYVLIAAEKGNSIFYEDFEVIATGKEGKLGDLIKMNNKGESILSEILSSEIFTTPYGIIAIVAVVLLVAGAVVTVVIIKKKKSV